MLKPISLLLINRCASRSAMPQDDGGRDGGGQDAFVFWTRSAGRRERPSPLIDLGVIVHGVYRLVHGVHRLVHGMHGLVHGMHRLVHGVHRLVHGVHRLVHGMHRLVHAVHWLMHAVHWLVHGVHWLVQGVHWLVHGVHRPVHRREFARASPCIGSCIALHRRVQRHESARTPREIGRFTMENTERSTNYGA
ncbi:MAG TPA: hypothetical protein VEK57_13985 [Thermoanaerobaculia bacterium]|nr:hypothetical protein [Thermoanaerobaculia bacterium]